MRQVRKGLFETNSSSTHAICVSRNMNEVDGHDLWSWYDSYCFGRCESMIVESWSAKLAYAYLVVKDLQDWDYVKNRRDTSHDLENFKNMVFDIAKDYYIEVKDEYDVRNGFTESNFAHFFDNINALAEHYDAYVDHVEDFADNGFYDKLVTDKEFIRRLVFNEDSYITVGGDEYRGYNIKKIGFENDYEYSYAKHDIKDETYYEHYHDPREQYVGEFWDKVKEAEKDFEIFFKGN